MQPSKYCIINPFIKNIVKISWPIIIGQLGLVLTGFFDNLMVAKLGHEALAAAGICNSIYFLIAVFPLGITISYSTITGIFQGKNHRHSRYIFIRDAFYATVVVSILTIAILNVFIEHFVWFKQEAEVTTLSIPYLKLLTWSFTPMIFFFMFKNIADGHSYTKAGMVVTLTALLINVFLNWVFIYGNLGSPAYGLNGAGYATIISRVYLMLAMAYFLFKSDQVGLDFKKLIKFWNRFKKLPFIPQIRSLGIPTGLQYFYEVSAFVFAAIMAGWISSEALAAHQLSITIASLTFMVASGISAGASISVANSYGKKGWDSVYNFGINAHYLTGSVMLLFALLFVAFRHPLASLFASEPEVLELGAGLLLIAGIFQLADGIQAVSVGLLRGIEDTKIPSWVIFLAYWLFGMPVAYYLGFETSLFGLKPIYGIWVGLTLGLILTAGLLSTRFYYLLRKLK